MGKRIVRDDGGPAFGDGSPQHGGHQGMNLRDWFAGQALARLYASGPHSCDGKGLASEAYAAADATLSAREGEKG